jgi:Holliday junction resolvasome RuvABC endonuclease subunit
MPDTVHGVVNLLNTIRMERRDCEFKVVIEKVHSMPGQGVASTFTFGQGFGQLQGVIAALGLQCIEVIPNKWMKCIGTMPKEKAERKKFIKDWVEKRSGMSVPLYIADAVAIAYVAPTLWGGSNAI